MSNLMIVWVWSDESAKKPRKENETSTVIF